MLARLLPLAPLAVCLACGPSKEQPPTSWPAPPSGAWGDAEPAHSDVTYDPHGRDPCAVGLPEFYPDEDMGSVMGPPDPPEGTGRDEAPAVRMVLSDPEVAGRPYVVRAEVVHDSGLEYVEFGWGDGTRWHWEFRCGEPPPRGVEATCTQLGYAYILTVIPPPGFANIGVSARAMDGGMSSKTIGAKFERCPG